MARKKETTTEAAPDAAERRRQLYLLASNQGDAARAAGYSLSDALAAGYSLSNARAAGYSLSDALAAGYSLSDALAAGYSLRDARAAGYSLSDARAAGYSLSDALAAGYSLRDARAAGYSLSNALAAGYSLSNARAAGYSLSNALDQTPFVERPYTQILEAINKRERLFKQSTFGPDHYIPPENICNTPMCTAGHLVSLAGEAGWKIKRKFDFAIAGALIHEKAHPGWPCQNFGAIPDEWALAYIEEMASHEAAGTVPQGAVEVAP